MINEAKLNQLIGQMLSDLGGASSVAMVRIGDALGLYKALHTKGAMTARELAAAVGANGEDRFCDRSQVCVLGFELSSNPTCSEPRHGRRRRAGPLDVARSCQEVCR